MNMQDSGQRQQFATGAQRDTAEDKPRPDLISPFAEQRLGEWLAKGAKKYAERNWEQGMPFSRCTASLNRHLMQWKQGDESEDHLAAIMFNAMALIHYQEMIDRGVLDADLGDMPDYDPDEGEDNEDPWEKEPACTCGVDVGEKHRPHCAVMRRLEKVHVSLDQQVGPFYTSPSDETSTCLEDVEVVSREPYTYEGASVISKLLENGCTAEIAKVIKGGFRLPARRYDTIFPRRYAYIAGPMRGYEQFNFPAFDRAQRALSRAGYCTISPADVDRACGNTDGSDDTPYYPETDRDRVRRDVYRDFHAIHVLEPEHGDLLVLLPGWENSTGASAEFHLARWLGIPAVKFDPDSEALIEL